MASPWCRSRRRPVQGIDELIGAIADHTGAAESSGAGRAAGRVAAEIRNLALGRVDARIDTAAAPN